MDWQEDNAVKAKRAEDMKTSQQITLGELILKLEAVADKSKPVVFDDCRYHPVSIDSWRGSYSELALGYAEAFLPLSVDEFLQMLKRAVGATFHGYKGGEFLMGRITPVWVANYGESHGFKHETQAVVDISQDERYVIIETKPLEY